MEYVSSVAHVALLDVRPFLLAAPQNMIDAWWMKLFPLEKMHRACTLLGRLGSLPNRIDTRPNDFFSVGIAFRTREGWDLEWPFVAGKVKKTLKSVGTTCDAKNYALFDEDVGYIVHKADVSYIEFGRLGNVYAIDVWVRICSRADKEASGFTPPVAAP